MSIADEWTNAANVQHGALSKRTLREQLKADAEEWIAKNGPIPEVEGFTMRREMTHQSWKDFTIAASRGGRKNGRRSATLPALSPNITSR